MPASIILQILIVTILTHHRHLGFTLYLFWHSLNTSQNITQAANLSVASYIIKRACTWARIFRSTFKSLLIFIYTTYNSFTSFIEVILYRIDLRVVIRVNCESDNFFWSWFGKIGEYNLIFAWCSRVKQNYTLILILALVKHTLLIRA